MSDPKETKLAQALRHVVSGKRIVAAQEKIISQIKAEGGNAKDAESLLDCFLRTQATFEDDLRLVVKEKG
jgi:hypothetical protein